MAVLEGITVFSIKRFRAVAVVCMALVVALSLVTLTSPIARAEEDQNAAKLCDTQFYSGNDILFYNPCEQGASTCSESGGTISASAPSQLSGSSNAEKVWNYFIGRGLTPVAAAGAMGNIEQESSFNPLIQEGNGIGFGLIQWSFERRTNLDRAAASAGVSFANRPENNDPALLFQLNYLWDGEYGEATWQAPTNAETTVEGDPSVSYEADNTGNGSALVFHKLVERSGDGTAGKQERIDSARAFLEQFGGSANGCTVGEGGMTLQQAESLMDYYANRDPDSERLARFNAKSNGAAARCDGATLKEQVLANCTAFVRYFTNKFTTYNDAAGNGGEKVDALAGTNPGARTGTSPQVFSIFQTSADSTNSSVGHTAIILGIHGDTAVIGEASCGAGYVGIRAYERPVSQITGGDYKYFYMEDVNQSAINQVIGGASS